MEFLPKAFGGLARYKQFIIYLLTQSKSRPGKMDKLPINWRTGKVANAHDSKIWLSAEEAITKAKEFGSMAGVGFVFTKNDPFFFLDIDDCLLPDNATWSQLALTLITTFAGAAVEVSSSGKGLHIIGSGTVPSHCCRNGDEKLELYTSGRFVALTGISAMGDSDADCSIVLPWLVDNYFRPAQVVPETSFNWTNEPCPEWNGNKDDVELITRALASTGARSVFGDGATFCDLWEANEPILAKAYPPNDADTYDRSCADAALAQHLAFWTGKNCERIQRLMGVSALKREKWEREDYLPRTIQSACGRQQDVLCDKPPQYAIAPDESEVPRPQLVTGSTFLTIDQQIDYFTGCVYILDEHKIITPEGEILTPDRFKTYYGGYVMPLDNANTKTTRNAFEAFTESQAFRAPRVQSSCFRPDQRAGGIIVKDGQRLVNTYYPVQTPRVQGNPAPFLRHIDKLFPNPQDKAIILAYLAALIQHKGIKFQWAPLIQGVQGNGKTLITRIIAFAIGQRYCHFPKASDIDNKFNGWIYRMLFIGVEDIYLADAKTHVIEILKPMVTNERQEVEIKGRDKITVDVCANFLINTNHKDGLRKTRDDRRFAPFYTPQQTVEDLKRDGMLGDYFPELRKWLEKQNGYAIVAYYLENYVISDDLNPATLCIRAPQTSSTEAAIEHGVGRIEQEILEAIEQGLCGFRGGWISSIFLDRLLKDIKADRAIPMRKRRELVQSLGYDWHPMLKEGRMTRIIQPDGSKPALYIKTGHPQTFLKSTEEIAKAYTDAQSNS